MIPVLLDTYDWKEAFAFAEEAQPVLGASCHTGGFTRGDVADVLFLEEGETGQRPWIGIFRLQDGRYAYLAVAKATEAVGFYAATVQVATNFHELITFGVGEASRRRLGLCLPDDPP